MTTPIRCTRSPSVPMRRCIIPGARRMPGCGRSTARTRSMSRAMSATEGVGDGDWALVSSQSAEIRVPGARMEAVNGSTLWTWNAIGKRAGAWALGQGRAGGHARLPAQPSDRRTAAAQGRRPALGQFRPDHRPGGLVRPAGVDRKSGSGPANGSQPDAGAQNSPVGPAPSQCRLRAGESAMTSLPKPPKNASAW
jgi:hypothetical protein